MVAVAKRERRVTDFGARLRALREKAGLSQSELGERAGGIAYQTIAKYERQAMEPNWPTVLDLARALGVSVAEFAEAEPSVALPVSRPLGKRK
jgi:transcriptional regulator with XRE-family HTH domain